jgi:RNase H-fold protein (predicted Holliday junction resolvase)
VLILSIDPGREKCGVALVDSGASAGKDALNKSVLPFNVVFRAIVKTIELEARLFEIFSKTPVNIVLCGDSTFSAEVVRMIGSALKSACIGASVLLVDEKNSTLDARKGYFEDNPPRGIWRFVPLSLQSPPVPIDDYVAIELARRHIESHTETHSEAHTAS